MNEWIKSTIEIAAAGGTLWAAIAAQQSAKISREQLEGQIHQKEQIDLPRLVPVNAFIQSEVLKMNSDWKKIDSTKLNDDKESTQSESVMLKKLNKFSSYTLPLINTGKLFAFDVRYNYVFEGGRDAVKDYEFDDVKIKVLNPEEGQLESNRFKFKFEQKYNGITVSDIVKVEPYVRFIPIIKSEETVELLVPAYFVLLSNIYIKSNWVHYRNAMHRPKLILRLMYTDQYYQVHTLVYRMALSLKQVHTKGFESEYIETWIDFELISSDIKKGPII